MAAINTTAQASVLYDWLRLNSVAILPAHIFQARAPAAAACLLKLPPQ
jgi:hypothetical protein